MTTIIKEPLELKSYTYSSSKLLKKRYNDLLLYDNTLDISDIIISTPKELILLTEYRQSNLNQLSILKKTFNKFFKKIKC